MMKKRISVLLALLLVLTAALSLQAAAVPGDEAPAGLERHNGPLTPEVNMFAAQFTSLRLNELNEDGTSKQDEDYGWIGYVLFANEYDEAAGGWKTAQDKLPAGVAYDPATNTVTLTDYDGSGYLLSANMMGDDLTLCVNGACSLGHIAVWGDGWGGSLTVKGAGTLTVNGNKLFDAAVDFYPEGAAITFRLDKETAVRLCGKKNAVSVNGTTQTEDLFDLPSGAKAEPEKKTFVSHEPKWVYGYTIDKDYQFSYGWTLGVCRDDPEGIYTLQETTYYPDGIDQPGIDKIDVTHYYYSEKYDVYLEDYSFGDEDGHTSRTFDDLAAAKAAGFEQKKDADGNPIVIEMKTPGGSGSSSIVIGPDGKEYASAWTKKPDGSYGDVLAEIEPLPGVEDVYLFIVRKDLIDIDPETLDPVSVDVTYDDMFTWTIPGEEFRYEGTETAPTWTPGDVDGDGKITSADARLALRRSVGLEDYPEGSAAYLACDVDHDGKVTSADARLILRGSVGLEDVTKW